MQLLIVDTFVQKRWQKVLYLCMQLLAVMIYVVVFDVCGVLVFKESRMCLFFVLLGVSKLRERSQKLCFRETQIV